MQLSSMTVDQIVMANELVCTQFSQLVMRPSFHLTSRFPASTPRSLMNNVSLER